MIFAAIFIALSVAGAKAQKDVKADFTISTDKMTDLYKRLDNPITIAVPGVANENLKPSISSGSLMPQGNGKFIARINDDVKTVKIELSVEKDGKLSKVGSKEFNVKPIPDPIAMIANKKGGTITRQELLAAGALIPVIENFKLETFFIITEFSLSILKDKDLIVKRTNGNLLNSEMKDLIINAASGEKIYFENIKAVGIDGNVRSLSAINLTITDNL